MADIYEDACTVNPTSYPDEKSGPTLDLSPAAGGKTDVSSSECDESFPAPDIADHHGYIPGVGMATAGQSPGRSGTLLKIVSFILLMLSCCLLAVVVCMCLAIQQSVDQEQEEMGKVTRMEQLLANDLSIILTRHENLTNQMSQQVMNQEAMVKKLSDILTSQENITGGWSQLMEKMSAIGESDEEHIKKLSSSIVREVMQQFMSWRKHMWFG
ncbi:uncharacterized protein LOC144928394 [Branchiostoma floridae x Branchiostoma belcheri]